MKYLTVKGVDTPVSRIGLGGEQLGGYGWGEASRQELVGAVRRAIDLGVTLFDTAPIYGLGRSEELLGDELRFHRRDVAISTKCGLGWEVEPRFRKWPDGSAQRVKLDVEGSLRRLQTDYVDICLVHWPDASISLDETFGALGDLCTSGKVRAIGCCNFTAELLRKVFMICDVSMVQISYNLLDTAAATDILPLCRERGVAVVAYSPLARGLLTGKYASGSAFGPADNRSRHPYVTQSDWREWPSVATRLAEIAASVGCTAAELAVNWVLATEGISAALVGAKRPEQIEAICTGNGRELPRGLLSGLLELIRRNRHAPREGN